MLDEQGKELLARAKTALDKWKKLPPEVRMRQLRESGIIDEQGRVIHNGAAKKKNKSNEAH